MSKISLLKTEGIVISRRNSYNSDVFLTLFTKKYGKLDVLAKRSKSYKSKLNASSRSFVCSEYILKAASVPIVMSADILCSNLSILDSYESLATASYLSEFVQKTTREEHSEPRLYLLLKDLLALLAGKNVPAGIIRAYFVTRLCDELGIMPNLEVCNRCGVSGGESDFASVEFGRLCENCSQGHDDPVGSRLFRFLCYLQQISPDRLHKIKLDKGLLKGATDFSERLLFYHLDIGEIKSKELLEL